MNALIREMQRLIGRHIQYQGCHCEIIEVLAEGPAVVLYRHKPGVIQANLFGEAVRKAPNTFTLPLYSRVADDLHPAITSALSDDEAAHLRQLLTTSRSPEEPT